MCEDEKFREPQPVALVFRAVSSLLLVALFLASCNLLFPIDYGTPQAIDVPNSSFESPAGITDNGLLNVVSSWTPGGSWYGKFKSTIVPNGEYAIWSSYTNEGLMPENGWSQELPTVYAEGKFVLTVLTMADNDNGLISRLYLGYDSGNDTYKVLDTAEVLISYDSQADGFSWSNWITLRIEYEVRSWSGALGKPIWIRMSTQSEPTGKGGASCWWDNVSLTVAYPVQ
jgi:hypothetical protein